MRQMDPNLEEAAVVSGVNRVSTFLHVSAPLLLPAIFGAAIFVTMVAIAIFEVPAILVGLGGGHPVLATELFLAVQGASEDANIRYGVGGVYAVLLALPSLVALYFYFRIIGLSHRFGVVTGKGYRPKDIDLGVWKWGGLAFVSFYLALAAFLPLLVLLWFSLVPLQLPSIAALDDITFRYYDPDALWRMFGGWPVIRNTIVLVVTVAVTVTFASMMISWIVVRTRLRIRRYYDIGAMPPASDSGIGLRLFAVHHRAVRGCLLACVSSDRNAGHHHRCQYSEPPVLHNEDHQRVTHPGPE